MVPQEVFSGPCSSDSGGFSGLFPLFLCPGCLLGPSFSGHLPRSRFMGSERSSRECSVLPHSFYSSPFLGLGDRACCTLYHYYALGSTRGRSSPLSDSGEVRVLQGVSELAILGFVLCCDVGRSPFTLVPFSRRPESLMRFALLLCRPVQREPGKENHSNGLLRAT